MAEHGNSASEVADTEGLPAAELVGHFAEDDGTNLFFHGFAQSEHLLQALLAGEMGRARLTSCGNALSSSVPHMNRIWFRPRGISMVPVYYPVAIDSYQAQYVAARALGLHDAMSAVVGQDCYRAENEWCYRGVIPLDMVDITKIEYRPGTAKEHVDALRGIATRLGCALQRYGDDT